VDTTEILIDALGWAVLLGGTFWYVRRNKHPSLGAGRAFLIFVGVFGGVTLAALGAVAGLCLNFMPEGAKVPVALGAILALAVVVPAWRLAIRLIQRPPKAKASNA
jgi:hypothetical protein